MCNIVILPRTIKSSVLSVFFLNMRLDLLACPSDLPCDEIVTEQEGEGATVGQDSMF